MAGLGGVGKTQTALEYAYRYVHDYKAVFWIDAETRETLFASFIGLADLLNLLERHDTDQRRIITAVQRWLTTHREWLVIFDNVEDIGLVRTMMPTSWSGTLLLTTQRQNVGAIAQVIYIDTMNAEESLQFLLRRSQILNPGAFAGASNGPLSLQDEQATRDIVTLMDGFPLALDQAGAYIETTRCSCAEFLSLLHSSWLRILEERVAEADHPTSVLRTFALAFEKVKERNPFASELLTVCAFLAPDAIPEALLIENASLLGPTFHEAASDQLQFNAAIRELLAYSLIQRHTHTLTIHRLVQAVIVDRLTEEAQREWMQRIVSVLQQAFPAENEHMECWPWCEQLMPHAVKMVTSLEIVGDLPETASLLHKIATYLHHRTHHQQAEIYHRRALSLREQARELDERGVVESLIGLLEVSWFQDKYTEAIFYAQRAIDILERKNGSNHFDIIRPLNFLAQFHCMQGQYAEAEKLLLRSLAIWIIKILHDFYFVDQACYPALICEAGEHSAQVLIQQALFLWKQAPRRYHYPIGHTLAALSHTYMEQQRYREAEAILLPMYDLGQQALGADNLLVNLALMILAENYQKQRKWVEAEQCYSRALTVLEQALGISHPRTKAALASYTQLLREM